MMQADSPKTVVVLATGGTIAGLSTAASSRGYTAAQVDVEGLLGGVDVPADVCVRSEQVAQIDSKDMTHEVWQALALRCREQLAHDDVAGVVVTHGTDTMEESAWFLQRVLAPAKPIVLVGAMRPADAADADGPRNLADALRVAACGRFHGVVVAMGGDVFDATLVRKWHPHRIDAFASPASPPLARIVDGRVELQREAPPPPPALGDACLEQPVAAWPGVAIVASHAGVDGRWIDALVDGGVEGLVVETTGNGTLHAAVEDALRRATTRGVHVVRATRCPHGAIDDRDVEWPASRAASVHKARVELMLSIVEGKANGKT